jgi:hypothetical protein
MLKWHVAQPVGLISIAALQQAENHVPSLLLVPSSKQSDFPSTSAAKVLSMPSWK